MLPRPATTWTRGGFSSLAPCRRGDRLVWPGASAEPSSPRVPGALADLGPVQEFAGDASRPAFDPMVNHPVGWELRPRWLTGLRERAHTGSRAGRGTS